MTYTPKTDEEKLNEADWKRIVAVYDALVKAEKGVIDGSQGRQDHQAT